MADRAREVQDTLWSLPPETDMAPIVGELRGYINRLADTAEELASTLPDIPLCADAVDMAEYARARVQTSDDARFLAYAFSFTVLHLVDTVRTLQGCQ
jgi:hypothetical protein